MDDIRHIKCNQDEAEAIMDEMTFGGCKRLFVDSSSDEGVWHLAAINDASEACIYCDFFDPCSKTQRQGARRDLTR